MKYVPYSSLLDAGKKITYQELLLTFEWRKRRSEIIERDYKRCTNCDYAETFGHKSSETGEYSYITDDGTEETVTFTNKEGKIVTENIPTLIVTDKPYYMHVHHKYYVYNVLPWDYPDAALITLCNWCHIEVHQSENIVMYSDKTLREFETLTNCDRCGGTGWLPEFKHVQSGVCFKCNGARFKTMLFQNHG